MRIGVIGAMQMEVDELKASMENAKTEEYSGVTYVSGTIEGKEVVAAVCGIGKVFAAICAEAMILKFNVDCVINIGVAGTLCKELGVMDVAVADQVVQHDMNTSALGDPIGLLSGLNQVFLPVMRRCVSFCAPVCRIKESIIKSERLQRVICSFIRKHRKLSYMRALMRLQERWKAEASDMSAT